ncbi:MAG: hypothetical protein GEV28_31125 [Actinophytocola sp.]|uniref:hypothetical protein n=1 Tax=Actinophytocola sp. TaxID=1872138 RepID=UPI0013273DD6|nr:hypothetical protein [Actinophytocola sp.]MPZ84599.1 hypothetical protein [Actinophytocola sp.]
MRRLFLLTLPGLAVGFIAGVALVAALSLGVPLALLGGGYTMMLINKKVRLGGFAPAALYWLIGFPLARLLHELLTTWYVGGTPTLPPDTLGFLAFQGIISAGFAIGFLWLHERVAPRWWGRLAERDEAARDIYLRYAAHATAIFEAKERRKAVAKRYRGGSGRKASSAR